MSFYSNNDLAAVVGAKVLGVYMTLDSLIFKTDQGFFAYKVYGDCCSVSEFHDFLGVEKLIVGGPIISVAECAASAECEGFTREYDDESITNYGYEFVVESPEFGEVTAVVSFRNSSNGYYGGWMAFAGRSDDAPDVPFLTTDIHEVL